MIYEPFFKGRTSWQGRNQSRCGRPRQEAAEGQGNWDNGLATIWRSGENWNRRLTGAEKARDLWEDEKKRGCKELK